MALDKASKHVQSADTAAQPQLQADAAAKSPSITTRRDRRRRLQLYAVLVPFFLLEALWIFGFYGEGALRTGPNGKAFGADYAMYFSAARLMRHGENLYDHNLLYRTEVAFLRERGLELPDQRAVVRVGNPPLFFWALRPLTDLPFQPVALWWDLGLLVLSGIGFLGCLRYLGWHIRALPLVFFLLMPQVVLGAFYGNPIGLVFAGIGCALALLRRRPELAGALLAVAWLKPPVALPVALLILLFHPGIRTRLLGGFLAASVLLAVANVLATGPHLLGLWLKGMMGYSSDIATSPNISSLAGLYVRWAPGGLRTGLEAVTLLSALGLTAVLFMRHRDAQVIPIRSLALLWVVWFLATPYAHFYDEILLTLPLLALIGQDASHITAKAPATALFLMLLSLALLSWTPHGIQLLSMPLALVIFLMWLTRWDAMYATP